MKKIIGIVPASNDLFNTDFVYEDKYCISNNYITRIKESGGIPIGVLPEGIYIDDEDLEILEIAKNKKSIIILNKMDLATKINEQNEKIKQTNAPIIKISALKKEGIEKLEEEITKLFNLNEINLDNEIVITNARHKNLISKAIENVKKTKETMKNEMPLDIVAIFIKDILEDLANITGEIVTDDIIDEIFANFCLGK